jgi:hypothetical protein
MENMEKCKLNSGNIYKYERKVGWIVERFEKIWKKSKMNMEIHGKYGKKASWIVKIFRYMKES